MKNEIENNVDNETKMKSAFIDIKKLGFVKSERPKNTNGGIGNTFEYYLGVKENNCKTPDIYGFEVKCKLESSSSYVSLLTKSPTYPKFANSILKNNYGELVGTIFSYSKKLYASVFAHRIGIVYEKYSMKLYVDRVDKKIYLEIIDLSNNKLYRDVYWSFDDLMKASNKKMKKLFLVLADNKEIDNIAHYNYTKSESYSNFNFEKFINCIENGKMMLDIRISTYTTGKNEGKTHDHGSAFRIKKENIFELYD